MIRRSILIDGRTKETNGRMVDRLWFTFCGWLVIWLCVCDYAGVLLAMTTMTDDDGRWQQQRSLRTNRTHTHIVLLWRKQQYYLLLLRKYSGLRSRSVHNIQLASRRCVLCTTMTKRGQTLTVPVVFSTSGTACCLSWPRFFMNIFLPAKLAETHRYVSLRFLIKYGSFLTVGGLFNRFVAATSN